MNEKYRKQSLRMFSYGVYILSSLNEGEYCVSTVTWVSQASFEPPMISVCIKRDSASYEIVKKRGEFILHLLGDNQKELASTFFKPTIFENEKLNGKEFIIGKILAVRQSELFFRLTMRINLIGVLWYFLQIPFFY